jgi:hypothetical protein
LFHDKKWTRHNQNVIDERISSSDGYSLVM